MTTRLVPYRKEFTGTVSGDRAQLQGQQAAQAVNQVTGTYTLRALRYATLSANFTKTGNTWTDIPGWSVTVTDAFPSDWLVVDLVVGGYSSAANSQVRLAVVDGGTTYTNASADTFAQSLGGAAYFTSSQNVLCTVLGAWSVRSKGDVIVKPQAIARGGATCTVYGPAMQPDQSLWGYPMLRIQHMRPVQ
jgi:hypothetical protein